MRLSPIFMQSRSIKGFSENRECWWQNTRKVKTTQSASGPVTYFHYLQSHETMRQCANVRIQYTASLFLAEFGVALLTC